MKRFLSWMGKRLANGVVTGLFAILTISGVVFAINWPSSGGNPTAPAGEVVGGKFTQYFNNMFDSDCASWSSLQGFTSTWVIVCTTNSASSGTDLWTANGTSKIYYNSGSVGIGTNNPGTNKLQVMGKGYFGDDVTASGQFMASSNGDSALSPGFTWSTDPNTGIYNPAADQIGFTTNGSDKMVINAAWNIGVGIAPSSTYKLNVNGKVNGDEICINGVCKGSWSTGAGAYGWYTFYIDWYTDKKMFWMGVVKNDKFYGLTYCDPATVNWSCGYDSNIDCSDSPYWTYWSQESCTHFYGASYTSGGFYRYKVSVNGLNINTVTQKW